LPDSGCALSGARVLSFMLQPSSKPSDEPT
jgi:hypothetical protein